MFPTYNQGIVGPDYNHIYSTDGVGGGVKPDKSHPEESVIGQLKVELKVFLPGLGVEFRG